jgi:hypothetical protein
VYAVPAGRLRPQANEGIGQEEEVPESPGPRRHGYPAIIRDDPDGGRGLVVDLSLDDRNGWIVWAARSVFIPGLRSTAVSKARPTGVTSVGIPFT